jgi:hypothetical protein
MRAVLHWVFGIVLLGVLRWAFVSFAWDTTVHILQSKLGISEAEVITGMSSFIIPGILAFCSIAGTYILARRYPVSSSTHAIALPAQRTGAASATSVAFRPFLIQSVVILAVVSVGVGYYLHGYVHYGEVDTAAIKSAFVNFQDYTEVSGRTYRHETVRLDGLRCHKCIFDDVVLLWQGTAPFILDTPTFVKDDQGKVEYNIRSDNPIIMGTEVPLKDVGATPSSQFRGGHGPP